MKEYKLPAGSSIIIVLLKVEIPTGRYERFRDPYGYGYNVQHTNGEKTWELLHQMGLNNLVNKAKNKIHNAIFLLEIE